MGITRGAGPQGRLDLVRQARIAEILHEAISSVATRSAAVSQSAAASPPAGSSARAAGATEACS